MARVRPVAQRIHNPEIETGQRRCAFGRHGAQVARVAQVAKAKAIRRNVAVDLQQRQSRDGPAVASDGQRLAGYQPMFAHDRWILTARRRLEAIAEALVHGLRGGFIEIYIDQTPAFDEQRAQVVDAVGVVGMLVRIEDAVEPIDVGVQELFAQIGRRVDEDPCNAGVVAALHEQRGAPAPVLRIFWIAVAPTQRWAWHAAGRPAAQDRKFQWHFRNIMPLPPRGAAPWRTAGRNSQWFVGLWRRTKRRAPQPAYLQSRPQRPVRCVCRDSGRAPDRARRSQRGCGPLAILPRWRAVRANS